MVMALGKRSPTAAGAGPFTTLVLVPDRARFSAAFAAQVIAGGIATPGGRRGTH